MATKPSATTKAIDPATAALGYLQTALQGTLKKATPAKPTTAPVQATKATPSGIATLLPAKATTIAAPSTPATKASTAINISPVMFEKYPLLAGALPEAAATAKKESAATKAAYDKIFSEPYAQSPKKGTAVKEYGGAFFGVPGLSPSSVAKPAGGWEAYQKKVSTTPGAGLVTLGLDPRDPQLEQKVDAWIAYNQPRGTGLWQNGAWGSKFGREDAQVPGFAALKKQYPKATDAEILDVVMRQQYGQSALPPRTFDIESIIDPLVEVALGFVPVVGPGLATAYGGIKGAVNDGFLGALTGGLGGYGLGGLGSTIAEQGLSGAISGAFNNAGSGLGDFFSDPLGTAGKYLSDTVSNVTGSLKDIGNVFAHPIDTLENVGSAFGKSYDTMKFNYEMTGNPLVGPFKGYQPDLNYSFASNDSTPVMGPEDPRLNQPIDMGEIVITAPRTPTLSTPMFPSMSATDLAKAGFSVVGNQLVPTRDVKPSGIPFTTDMSKPLIQTTPKPKPKPKPPTTKDISSTFNVKADPNAVVGPPKPLTKDLSSTFYTPQNPNAIMGPPAPTTGTAVDTAGINGTTGGATLGDLSGVLSGLSGGTGAGTIRDLGGQLGGGSGSGTGTGTTGTGTTGTGTTGTGTTGTGTGTGTKDMSQDTSQDTSKDTTTSTGGLSGGVTGTGTDGGNPPTPIDPTTGGANLDDILNIVIPPKKPPTPPTSSGGQGTAATGTPTTIEPWVYGLNYLGPKLGATAREAKYFKPKKSYEDIYTLPPALAAYTPEPPFADGGMVMKDPMNPMGTDYMHAMNPMGNLPTMAYRETPNMRNAAYGLASLGRGPDSMLVHMAPQEVQALQNMAQATGGSLTTNPQTGLPEAGWLSDLLPAIGGIGLSMMGFSPLQAGLTTGIISGLASGSAKQGLIGGLGGFGGATLGRGVLGLGGADLGAMDKMGFGEKLSGGFGNVGDNLGTAMKGIGTLFDTGVGKEASIAGAGLLGKGLTPYVLGGGMALAPALFKEEKFVPPNAAYGGNPYGKYGADVLQKYRYQGPYTYQRKYQPMPKTWNPAKQGEWQYFTPGQLVDAQGNPAPFAEGGLASFQELAKGGEAGGRYLDGPGDGMSDDIPAHIDGVQPAKLADGEFVIPADVVSHLGNGSSKAGAQRLYSMMDKIREARTGNPEQGKQINPNRFLPA